MALQARIHNIIKCRPEGIAQPQSGACCKVRRDLPLLQQDILHRGVPFRQIDLIADQVEISRKPESEPFVQPYGYPVVELYPVFGHIVQERRGLQSGENITPGLPEAQLNIQRVVQEVFLNLPENRTLKVLLMLKPNPVGKGNLPAQDFLVGEDVVLQGRVKIVGLSNIIEGALAYAAKHAGRPVIGDTLDDTPR